MGELPLYELRIDFDDDTGVDQISLVDKPAIEIDWQHFNKSKESFKVLNEDKRIIAGFAMIANQNIYRNDKSGEYNVFFSKDTITQIIQKFFKTKTTDATNIMHTELTADDTYIIESFQIDSDRGIVTPKGFTEQVDGSWFVSMKVDSDKVWEEVKGGVYKGFSVEGIFDHVRQEFAGFNPKQTRNPDGTWGSDNTPRIQPISWDEKILGKPPTVEEDLEKKLKYSITEEGDIIDSEYATFKHNGILYKVRISDHYPEIDRVVTDLSDDDTLVYFNFSYDKGGKWTSATSEDLDDFVYNGYDGKYTNIEPGRFATYYLEEGWDKKKKLDVINKVVNKYLTSGKFPRDTYGFNEKENNNEQMNNTEKTIFNKIKQLLSGSEAKEEEVVITEEAIEVVFGEATLSDGTPIKWEGTLEVGTAIVVVTEEGDIPAPDGEHELADGTAIVKTEGGLVTEIMEMEMVAEEAEPVEEVADLTEVMTELMKEVGEKFNAYEIQLAEIKKDLDAKNEKIVELSKQEIATPVQKVAKTPKWKKFN